MARLLSRPFTIDGGGETLNWGKLVKIIESLSRLEKAHVVLEGVCTDDVLGDNPAVQGSITGDIQ